MHFSGHFRSSGVHLDHISLIIRSAGKNHSFMGSELVCTFFLLCRHWLHLELERFLRVRPVDEYSNAHWYPFFLHQRQTDGSSTGRLHYVSKNLRIRYLASRYQEKLAAMRRTPFLSFLQFQHLYFAVGADSAGRVEGVEEACGAVRLPR